MLPLPPADGEAGEASPDASLGSSPDASPGPSSEGASYSTEFGAVLEPGESFGWQGYTSSSLGYTAPTGADPMADPAEAAGGSSSSSSPRLVRIQRLYSRGSFVSGTTSLFTAV